MNIDRRLEAKNSDSPSMKETTDSERQEIRVVFKQSVEALFKESITNKEDFSEKNLKPNTNYLIDGKTFRTNDKGERKEIDVAAERGNINRLTDGDLSARLCPNSTYKIDGREYKTDDAGKVYTKGGKLLPSIEYILNKYFYKTDDVGRIVHAEANPLRLDQSQRDEKAQSEVGGSDRKEHDHGGHLLAYIFGGHGGIGNLVAMKGELNQGAYKKMENDLKKAVEEGHNVKVSIDVKYDNKTTQRPSEIKVTYTIDGTKYKKTFIN